MTIPSNTSPISTYTGNNVAFQFPFYFRALKAADVLVTVTSPLAVVSTLVQGVDYSFTYKNFPFLGGEVTLIDLSQGWMNAGALRTNWVVTIGYVVAPSQISKFRDWGPLAPVQVEQAFDKLTMDMIAVQSEIARGLLIPGGGGSESFPPLAGNANKIVQVNATEDGFAYGPDAADIFGAVTAAEAAQAAAATSETNAAASAAQALANKIATDNNVTIVDAIASSVALSETQAAEKAVDAQVSADQAFASMNTAIAQVPLATAQAALAAESAFEAETYVKLTYYTNIVNLTFADSPYTITLADDGKLFRVDTSLGDVVMNLTTRPAVSPDYRVSVLKLDNSAHSVIVNPYGADTVGGKAQEVLSLQFYGITFTPGPYSDWQEKIFTYGTSNSGLPTLVTEIPAGAVDGVNTLYTLSQNSLNGSVLFFLDGEKIPTADYSVLGNKVSLTTPPELGQTVEVWYFVTDVLTSGIKGQSEIPVGAIDGANLNFTVTSQAFNKASTIVFKNGLKTLSNTWTLLQTGAGSIITFNAGEAPEIGSSIEVFYLVNQLQAGINPPPLPGSGSGWTAHGNRLAPIVIDSTGITAADERRQLWYLKSNGGKVLIPGVQISAGFQVGDEMVIVGVDPVDYLSFVDGQGCEFNGAFDLIAGPPGPGVYTTKKHLIYDGVVWSETPMS